MQAHLIPPDIPRSIFVYFRGLFYDVGNDPEGGYYARYISCQLFDQTNIKLLRSKSSLGYGDCPHTLECA